MSRKIFVNFKFALFKYKWGPDYCGAYERYKVSFKIDEVYNRHDHIASRGIYSNADIALFESGAAVNFDYDGRIIAISAICEDGSSFEKIIAQPCDKEAEAELISSFGAFCKEGDEVWYMDDYNDYFDITGNKLDDKKWYLDYATEKVAEIFRAKIFDAVSVQFKDIVRIISVQSLHIKGCEGRYMPPTPADMNDVCLKAIGINEYAPTGTHVKFVYDKYKELIKKDKYSDEEIAHISEFWGIDNDTLTVLFSVGLEREVTRYRIALLRLFRDNRWKFTRTIERLFAHWQREKRSYDMYHVKEAKMLDFDIFLDYIGGRPCKPQKIKFMDDICCASELIPADFYTLAYDDLEDFDSPELQETIDYYKSRLARVL